MHGACKYDIRVNVDVLEILAYCSLLSASLIAGVHFRYHTVKTVFSSNLHKVSSECIENDNARS